MNNVEYHHSSLNNTIPLYVLLLIFVPLYLLARLSALSSLTTNMACKAPGNQKNNVKIKFNIAWTGLPTSKTATGGKTTAKRYIISLFPPSIDFYNNKQVSIAPHHWRSIVIRILFLFVLIKYKHNFIRSRIIIQVAIEVLITLPSAILPSYRY